jgi:hypothetical protein
MKKLLFSLMALALAFSGATQVVEDYGGGKVSDNPVMDKIDIKEIGRSIHVASVEAGNVVVRRYYREKWEEFDETPIKNIFKLKKLELFAYRATPYLFCYYDDHMTVIRAIDDKWEFVGEETFGEGSIDNPVFSVIGENPYIVYEDKEYEMIRMISLFDESWYDVDLISNVGIKSYQIAANDRGDLYLAFLNNEGIQFKEVDQEIENVDEWNDLSKMYKLEDAKRIDDFTFVENKAYLTYHNEFGPVIITLEDMAKKWEIVEEAEEHITFGPSDYNLNVSEYYFFTALSSKGIPQYLKNNKKGVWGDVTDLSKKKARSIASDDYRNVIYVAYVDDATQLLMVKKIEKGEDDE